MVVVVHRRSTLLLRPSIEQCTHYPISIYWGTEDLFTTSDSHEPMSDVEIEFDSRGLVPVIAQDIETDQVLMFAYANREAVDRTRETQRGHYYSRSREELWEKGKTSGHTQEVTEIRVDCDGDTLLYRVSQEGGACHTGHRSCFYRTIEGENIGERVFDPDDVYE